MGYNIPHQTPQQAGVANKDKQGRLVFLCDVATLLAATGGVATKDKQGRLVFLCDVATLDT
ncbi:hypothetical protein [Infectious spleen and kidney necrosis virus]|nr:hypothetical protein [Infectious spleen and kidney necrosis virus]WNH14624.1 hypothetical protein [Infectious spleen and kidney necrosis virus]